MESIQPLSIEHFIDQHDIDQCVRHYQPHKILIVENFMSSDYVINHYWPEIECCSQFVHRVKVAKFKKSGSVSRHVIQEHAPCLFDLYQSEVMKRFIEEIVGEPLCLCPQEDPHAIALYYYTEPGDHIGVHYDKSFYKGRRYTVLLGMIQDSMGSKLVYYQGANKTNRRKNPVEVLTPPGTLVVFSGDTLWHEVTPLGQGERRVILTMEYVTDPRISMFNRVVSNLKDRYLYFGR